MRKVLILVFMMVFTSLAFGVDLNESFEDGIPDDWTIINNDGGSKEWEQSSSQSYDGSYSAKVSYELPNDDWLITAPLKPVAGHNNLSFWYMSGSSTWLESFNVKLSTSGTNVSDFTETLGSIVDAPNAWTEFTYDLSTYNGQQIYIAVQCVSNNELSLYVDLFTGVEIVTPAPKVFFSEYIEGSSSNKAVEIYNGTGSDIDLSDFAIVRYNNGASDIGDENLYEFDATLLAGDVYVIGNSGAAPEYSTEFDETSTLTYYNGDDFLGLIYDFNGDNIFDVATEVIDAIGVLGVDPGSAWDVAGVTNATAEHTLLRKPSTKKGNIFWDSSAGTDADNSEWIVMEQNYFDHLGVFPYLPIALPYTENFDDLNAPDLPPLWESILNSTSDYASVETYNSSYSSYSEPICLKLYNSDDSAAELIAISPEVPVNVNNLRTKFWAKGGTGYTLEVGTYSPDGRGFTLAESIDLTLTYTEYEVNFSTYVGSDLNIAFRHGVASTYQTIYIDDVVIEEIPTTPIFSVNPLEYDFEIISINEESDPQIFTIKNTGIGSIEIASGGITIAGMNSNEFILTDENTYPIALGENQSVEVEVAFAPTSVGNKLATLQIVDNLSRTINEVPLSGAVPYSPYDIQYTEDVSGDSPFDGETLFVKGIVFANNWGSNQSYFIYDSTRTAEWNGLLIYDNNDNFPAIGDEIIIKGEVDEYNGMSELTNITYFTTTGGGNPLPIPEVLDVAAFGQEMYEGVLVKIEDLEVTQTVNAFGEFFVQNTGIPVEGQIDDGFDGFESTELNTDIGAEFYSITGVVDYGFGAFAINPRNYFDVIGEVLELPYFNDFETDDGDLTHDGVEDSWEYGVPGEGQVGDYTLYDLPGIGTWGNVWGTDLDSLYMPSTLSYLYTPFVDLSDLTIEDDSGTSISYSHWYHCESGWDGVNLKIFSLDNPQWTLIEPVLGYPDDTVNGIDDIGSNEPGFTGDHSYWEKVQFVIPDEYLGSIVAFKFVFGSDGSGQRPGYYINDLKISEPVPEIILSDKMVDFGEYQVGQSGNETITISNPASAPVPLVISSISSSNPYFSMIQGRDFSIDPGSTMDFEITFTPPSIGDFEGYFTITSNDPFTLPPYGNGVRIDVVGVGTEPYSEIDTDNLPINVNMFVDAGQTGSTQFDVTNLGVLPLDVDLELATRDFMVSTNQIIGIPYLGSETVTVDYDNSPLVNAVETNTLTLTTNEPMLPAGEQFAGWAATTPQSGWTVVDNNGVGDTWVFNNPGSRTINTPTAANGFAIFDSDAMSSGGGAEDCDLISPVLDFSDWTSVTFDFYHYFQSGFGGAAELLVSNDNSSSWSSVSSWTASTDNAQNESIDLTTYAAGYSEVLVKFKWTGDFSWYWGIDDVTVTDGTRTRSLTEPTPRSYAVNCNAYITEPYDSLNAETGYRAISSVLPTASRATDYPEYEWIDNMNEDNIYVMGSTVEFDSAFPYFGQELSSFSLYDNGTTTIWPILLFDYTPEERKELDLSAYTNTIKKEKDINDQFTNGLLSNLDRDAVPMENTIWLSNWSTSLGTFYVTQEEIGVVITADMPGLALAQVVLRPNGDVSFNFADVDLVGELFLDPDADNIVGMRGLGETEQIIYEQASWVNQNVRPEMTIRFYPEYNDTQLLPSTITMNEDEVFEMDVRDYIASGGDVLSITMTDPANLTTVIDGNMIEFHPALNYNNATGVTVGYVITAMARGNKVRSAGDILVKIMPVNDLPEIINPVADQYLMEDFGTVNIDIADVFFDPDNALDISLELSDPTKVSAEIVGTDIVLTSIDNAFTFRVGETDNPVIATLTANEVTTRRDGGLSMTASANSRDYTDLTFEISIEQVNDIPVVANPVPNLDVDEDESIAIDLSDVFLDVDGDPMTYGFELEVGTHLTAVIDEFNVLTLTPEADWSGSETVKISADDGVEASRASRVNKISVNSSREAVEDEFILTVNPVNDAPVVDNPIGTVVMAEDAVDTSIDLNAVFSDVDADYGDFLTFTESSNANIAVTIAAGIVTLEPAADWNGFVVVTFTATDIEGEFVQDVATIEVTPVNDPPTIDLPAQFTFNEGGTLARNFNQYVNDVDGDALTLSVTGNSFVTVTISGLNVTFGTVDPLDFGEELLTFTVDDGYNVPAMRSTSRDTDSDNVNIVVNYVNHAPEYEGPTYINLQEDFEPYTVGDMNDLFVDIDPIEYTNLTFEVVSFNANKINAYIDAEDMLMIEAVPNANGLSTLRIRANDNDSYAGRASLTTTRDIQVDVTAVNDPPLLVDLPEVIEMAANSYTFIDLEDNFIDVDDLTPLMEISTPEGFITATKLAGYNYRFRLSSLGVYGEDGYITVTVDDGHDRAVATADLYVTVAESEPPYVVYYIPNQEFEEDFALTEIADLDDCFADPDNPTLNYAVEVLTLDGENPVFEAQITEGENVLYVGSAVPDWNGFGQIRVDAWDVENRITVSQTIGITVMPVNDLPVATEISDVTLDEDFGTYTVVDLATVFTDVDGDDLEFALGNDQDFDVVIPEIIGTELVINSIPDIYGSTPVTVRVNDGSPFWVETTFMVFVNDIFDPPTFNPGLDGMDILISTEGQLVDLENLYGFDYVDNHGQINTVPIAFQLVGDTPYYDVTVSEDHLFGIDVTPTGYQWGYPNQDIRLILETGEEVIVTLITNFSPYILQPMPDMLVMSGDMFTIDPNYYFADPEGQDLSYNVIYDSDYFEMTGTSYFMFTVLQVVDTIYADITVIASDVEMRATAAQTFTVTIIEGEGFAPLASEVIVDAGEELRISLYDGMNAGMDSRYRIGENTQTTRIVGNELVVNYETDVRVIEEVKLYRELFEGIIQVEKINVTVNPRSEDDTPEYVTALGANYPNPFNPTTAISFSLAEAGEVEISIFNARGQFVKTVQSGHLDAGNHQAIWNGTSSNGNDVASGIYFYRMKSDNDEEMRKMILMK